MIVSVANGMSQDTEMTGLLGLDDMRDLLHQAPAAGFCRRVHMSHSQYHG